ncbi:helix-turn-helix transcriptional regulator [Nitratireductor sp. XY-223]|uniref:helix-turn-helix domain-containing protein n=1 Tax=Nitratireductor sp. XY-223 TaxID=2561926 RepID=UPI0010AA0DA7|nr:helix-turn-helix transcriptional regulator [Nitratireductor sp. XY-223]
MRYDIYSPLNQKLSTLLYEARKKAGITQRQLADGTGRTQAYISKFERGHLRLDVSDFIAFTAALGIDPHKLLDELIANLKAEAAKEAKTKKSAKTAKKAGPPPPKLTPDALTWTEEEFKTWLNEVKKWFDENPARAAVRQQPKPSKIKRAKK